MLDVVYECVMCGNMSVDSRTLTSEPSGFSLNPTECNCGVEYLRSSIRVHTEDEATA